MILWFGAEAAGGREFPSTVMEKTAGGVAFWRKNSQLDTEHMKVKLSVRYQSGGAGRQLDT